MTAPVVTLKVLTPAAMTTEVAARNTAITAAVNGLVNAAPGALNTLKELADAIGDDPNYAATLTAALANRKQLLTTTTVKSGAYTAAPWDLVPVDISAGSFPVTLPPASSKWEVVVKVKAASATFGSTSCTVTAAGSDVINAAGTTTLALSYVNQAKTFVSDGAGTITMAGGDITKAVLDQMYGSAAAVAANTAALAALGW